MRFAAVILAAGYSSRIGGFKPLMELGGQSLMVRCVGIFRGAGIKNIVAVTGHRHPEVEAEAARLGLIAIHNPDYDRGMFSPPLPGMPWSIPRSTAGAAIPRSFRRSSSRPSSPMTAKAD
jgi:molybdenum cofactor cytidylyltransferase